MCWRVSCSKFSPSLITSLLKDEVPTYGLPHLPLHVDPSCELSGVSTPQELVSHVRKIADAMVSMTTIAWGKVSCVLCCALQGLAHPDRIEVFISAGTSSVSGGSTNLPMGSIVGLPR